MASERTRILIYKFEMSSTAFSSRCTVVKAWQPKVAPDCSQSLIGTTPRYPSPPRPVPTRNYFCPEVP